MSDDREPFFTPSEWRATVVFRPRDWREWWRTEPRLTKILAACLTVMLGYGVHQLRWGDTAVGWPLVIVVVVCVALPLLAAPLVLFVASVRWVLRKIGVAARWRKVDKYQLKEAVRGFFWLGIIVLIIVGLWPYLSLHPIKSWYAFTNSVPVERVTMEKKPHDCDFATAPLGVKNCHYEARAFVVKEDDSPNARRSLIVSYEKVQD